MVAFREYRGEFEPECTLESAGERPEEGGARGLPSKKGSVSQSRRAKGKSAAKRKKPAAKKRVHKSPPTWDGLAYVGLFAVMLLCFGLGVWSRPYLESWVSRLRVPSVHSRKTRVHPRPSPRKVPSSTETSKQKQRSVTRSIPVPKKAPVPAKPLKPICLILDDFGYDLTPEVMEILALDPAINVAILPGLRFSRETMEVAHAYGHEVLIHAPFEGRSSNREKEYIRTGDSRRRVFALLSKWRASLPDAIGINNHQGSLATQDAPTMTKVMEYLKQCHMLFVDSWTARRTVGFRVARSMGVPAAARIVPFLDNTDREDAVRANFRILLDKAGGSHPPVAIGHITKHSTRKVLLEIVPELAAMGYRLIPVSLAVRPKWSETQWRSARQKIPLG